VTKLFLNDKFNEAISFWHLQWSNSMPPSECSSYPSEHLIAFRVLLPYGLSCHPFDCKAPEVVGCF